MLINFAWAFKSAGALVFKKCALATAITLSDFCLVINLVGFIAVLIAAKGNLYSLVPPKDKRLPLLVRSCCGQVTLFLFAAGGLFIPFGLHTLVYMTYPFIVSILAVWLNNEDMNKIDLVGMLICFSLVLLYTAQSDLSTQGSNYVIGILISITCAIVYSISMITSRRLKDTALLTVLFWYLLLGIIVQTSWMSVNYFIRGNLPGLF